MNEQEFIQKLKDKVLPQYQSWCADDPYLREPDQLSNTFRAYTDLENAGSLEALLGYMRDYGWTKYSAFHLCLEVMVDLPDDFRIPSGGWST